MAVQQKEPSSSERLREQGNEHYRSVQEGLAPLIQINRLQEALQFYSKAFAAATHDHEKSSACKNMAMANWKMACISYAETSSSLISDRFKMALMKFQDAKEYGRERDPGWQDNIVRLGLECWSEVHRRLDEWDYDARLAELEILVRFVVDDHTKAIEYLEIAKNYFHWSVTALSYRNYQHCLDLLGKVHFPLNETRRLGRHNADLIAECDVLDEDVFIQHCVASSIQARVSGEEMMDKLWDKEDLDMDMVWSVVDILRTAASLTRERDLELEAMALSALGKVYDRILKMKMRAKECLRHVLELADSMYPRTFNGCEWYRYAMDTVMGYQMEQNRQEMEEYVRNRAINLLLIKNEMDELKLKKENLSKVEFLKFLYATYPPKDPHHTLDEIPAEPEWTLLKRLYQKAVIHYHPDRVREDEHGIKWKTLTEEITKMLTQTYEFFKGCSQHTFTASEPEEASEPVETVSTEAPSEAMSETMPETASETVPEMESETAFETASETAPEIESETVPETASETAPEMESETVREMESETAFETSSETAPEIESETVPETASETAPEMESETVREMESETAFETASETAPEIESETVPETASETAPEMESETAPETA